MTVARQQIFGRNGSSRIGLAWVSRSRLKSVVEVAQMLKLHLDSLLTFTSPTPST
jgi:hypothetical protein